MRLMKHLSKFCLITSFVFGMMMTQAEGIQLQQMRCREDCSCCEYHLGSAGMASANPSLWYNVTVPAYPAAELISKNRNTGFRQGGVRIQSTGLKILEPGNYWVSFKATLQNPMADEGSVVSVLLGFDGAFDPNESGTIGTVVSLQPDGAGVAQATGILEDVPEGTTLSLFGSNGGGGDSVLIKIIGWDINIFKIPCD